MKKIITLSLLSAAALCGTLTSCDIERLPAGNMSAEQITGDPLASLDGLVNGAYAQLKHGRTQCTDSANMPVTT